MLLFLHLLFIQLTIAAPPTLDMDDAFAELDGKVKLHFFDTNTGQPIAGGIISFQGKNIKTNSEGTVSFPFPEIGVDETIMLPKDCSAS